jgi:hypothetical protein
MAELSYDIEQLYIEGLHPTKIAKQLECPLTVVYDWLESTGVAEEPDLGEFEPPELEVYDLEEVYSPYHGA